MPTRDDIPTLDSPHCLYCGGPLTEPFKPDSLGYKCWCRACNVPTPRGETADEAIERARGVVAQAQARAIRAETRVRALLNYLVVRKPAWKTPGRTLISEKWEIAVLFEMDAGNVRSLAHHTEILDSRDAAEARLWELVHCDRENARVIDRAGEPLVRAASGIDAKGDVDE